MKKYHLILSMLVLSGSCSPKLTSDWTKESYTDRSYTKIAVVGISKSLKARTEFEKTAVELFKERGINTVVGIDIFPPNMSQEQQKTANLMKIIKENNLDGIITMTLVDANESTKYQRGTNYTVPAGYYRFGNYLIRRYESVSSTGYYVATKSYLIEAVLYNLKGEISDREDALVWTGQSSLVDPSSIESAAKTFTKRMVTHMLDNGVVTPR